LVRHRRPVASSVADQYHLYSEWRLRLDRPLLVAAAGYVLFVLRLLHESGSSRLWRWGSVGRQGLEPLASERPGDRGESGALLALSCGNPAIDCQRLPTFYSLSWTGFGLNDLGDAPHSSGRRSYPGGLCFAMPGWPGGVKHAPSFDTPGVVWHPFGQDGGVTTTLAHPHPRARTRHR
jgi:hypothetical protein